MNKVDTFKICKTVYFSLFLFIEVVLFSSSGIHFDSS